MSLLKSGFTVSSWTFGSRILGFVRDVVLANKLGASTASDAFFVALILPNLLRRLFAEGAFNVAFIPLYSRWQEKDGTAAASFANQAFTWLALLMALAVLLAEIFMPQLIALLVPGYTQDIEKYNLTVLLARCTFPYLLLITLASMLGALCNAARKFAAFAFVPALLNVSLISSLLLTTPLGWNPAYAVALAVPAGGALQLGFMIWAFKRANLSVRFTFPRFSTPMKELAQRFWPAALGVGVLQISFLIDNFLASLLEGQAVSYLQFANRFYQMPLALIGTALATVLLPHLSQAFEKKDKPAISTALFQSFNGGLAIGLAATLGLCLLAHQIMGTMLQHGKFDATATDAVAWAMIGYTLGLPGYILTKVTSTAFFAAGDTKLPVRTAIAALVVNVAASFTLMQVYGHVGIAAATAISGWTNACLQLYFLHKRALFRLSHNAFLPVFGKILVANAGLALALLAYKALIPFVETSILLKVLWLGGAMGLGGSVFLISCLKLKLVEAQLLRRLLRRLLRKA